MEEPRDGSRRIGWARRRLRPVGREVGSGNENERGRKRVCGRSRRKGRERELVWVWFEIDEKEEGDEIYW